MGKEEKPKLDLEHVVAKLERVAEVEAKYLLQRGQAVDFLKSLDEARGKDFEKKDKYTSYEIEQGWISGGVNDGVRLRKRRKLPDGTEEFYITKKENGNKTNNSNKPDDYLGKDLFKYEQEIRVTREMTELMTFFETNWGKIGNNKIKKIRHEFLLKIDEEDRKKFLDTEVKIELDFFEGTELTCAEIEFRGDNKDEAINKRNKFNEKEKYKKFFSKLCKLDVVLLPYGSYTNRSLLADQTLLHGGFQKLTHYAELIAEIEKRKKKEEKKKREQAKKEAKEKRKAAKKEEKKRKKQLKKAMKKK